MTEGLPKVRQVWQQVLFDPPALCLLISILT